MADHRTSHRIDIKAQALQQVALQHRDETVDRPAELL
jgi:hypothetical protein